LISLSTADRRFSTSPLIRFSFSGGSQAHLRALLQANQESLLFAKLAGLSYPQNPPEFSLGN
jgi:hypothetical protein